MDIIGELRKMGMEFNADSKMGVFQLIDNRGGNYVGGNAQNTQMGAGQTVTQTGTWGTEQQSKFNELVAAINGHADLSKEDKDEAIGTLNDLKNMKEQGRLKEPKLKALWELLPPVVKALDIAGEMFLAFHGG